MDTLFLLLIIAIAVAAGCYIGQKHLLEVLDYNPALSKDYFTGLNYLLNEQPDKAVDVFTKLLQVDSETVETHLALGSLFRKRGEIGRAIKIHQNLIARPQLPKQHRTAALVALGKDYLQAGLVDRAERLFLEITTMGEAPEISLQYLLLIYQQQKNWHSAIKVAQQLNIFSGNRQQSNITIAHYHCELAQGYIYKNDYINAIKILKTALKQDINCVRANLLSGKIFFNLGQYKDAINTLQAILDQDKSYFSEGLEILSLAYIKLNQEKLLIDFLQQKFSHEADINVAIYLTNYYSQEKDAVFALNYLSKYLQTFPSLKGLAYLIELKNKNLEFNYLQDQIQEQPNKNYFIILKEIINNILKTFSQYRCSQCGFKSNQLIWLCPGCQQWSQIKPVKF